MENSIYFQLVYPGIRDSKPKHPDYALLSRRQKSFCRWSTSNKTDPAVLSKAGFLFTGIDDCVLCFFCGGRINNWQSDDNPWIEHAKWFPNCAYVNLCMGEAFVNFFRTGMRDQGNIPDDWLIRELNSDAAQTFMSSGFSQADVEKGIMHVRENYGKSGNNSKRILEFLKDLERSRHSNNTRVQERESPDNIRIPNEDIFTPSVNGDYPVPNLVFRGSNYQLPEATMKLAIEERRRKEEEENLLREENKKLREVTACKVCLDLLAKIVFLPCGHLVSCPYCANRLTTCAVCRAFIQRKVLVH